MKILITGGSGFIGRNIINHYSKNKKYKLSYPNHSELDLLNSYKVKEYLNTNKFDCVIHCAVVGGNRRLDIDSSEVYKLNMEMFENIIFSIPQKTKLINFGSGAEFSFPLSNYGKSKIHMKLIGDNKLNENYYHLRIYGCFGVNEEPERFISNSITNYINKSPILIHKNKLMDFVYIDDMLMCLDQVIKGKIKLFKNEVNVCYNRKYSLLDIANFINHLDTWTTPIIIQNENSGENYISNENNYQWDSEIGLLDSIKHVYSIRKII